MSSSVAGDAPGELGYGYSTGQFGKCHEVPVWQSSPMGIRMEFAYDGGGLGKGGDVTLFYDGDKVGEGRVQATQPMIFSAEETTDIGEDFGMPVSSDYGGTSRFNGKIDLVQIDLGDDTHDHLIDMEEVIRIAMARQ